tara:strand:+ start:3380 stop:4453 length:1074 start_codon:yes stop_codon:yes gene_type:complete
MKYVVKDKQGYLEGLAERLDDEGYDASYNSGGSTSNSVFISNSPIPQGDEKSHPFYIGMTETLYGLIRNRIYTYAVLKLFGLAVPRFWTPEGGSVDTGIIEDGKKYIIESTSTLSYINKRVEDAVRMLEIYNKMKATTMVREVPYEMELEVEGWFNGIQLVSPSYLIFDRSIMHPLPRSSKLHKESLSKLEEALKKTDFKGAICLRVGISEDKIYGLHLGMEMRPMAFEAMKGVAKSLVVIATASKNSINMYNLWTMQTPLMLSTTLKGLPLFGCSKESKKHLWLSHVISSNGDYSYHGTSNFLGYITARGETPRECIRRVERTKEMLFIPFALNLVFPEKVLERWKRLEGWGWVTS